VAPDLERQPRPVRITDVDALPVADVYRPHPSTVNEDSVLAAVVDRHPPAVVEAQHDMRARHQRMGHADVGTEIPPDDHVVARREGAL